MTKEEHFVLISEPGCDYLTHIAPASSKSNLVADCMIARLIDMGILCGLKLLVLTAQMLTQGTKVG